MVSLRRKEKALHFFLPSFQRSCERVKTCHPHFKNGGTKVLILRDTVNE